MITSETPPEAPKHVLQGGVLTLPTTYTSLCLPTHGEDYLDRGLMGGKVGYILYLSPAALLVEIFQAPLGVGGTT